MASLPQFHNRTGALVSLSNDNRTAQRNHPSQEFNNGVVLSAEPLRDDQVLEVKIDKKVNSWSGSIEIGVTTCDPDNLNFPISATGFREGTWVMSGSSVLKDGHSMIEEYGCDLDQLSEGDIVGVMRSSSSELHFFVNGVDQGVAATGIPAVVYAVIDMYGKCAQVSIIESTDNRVTGAMPQRSRSLNQEATEKETKLMQVREAPTGTPNDIAHQMANVFLAQLSSQIVNDLQRNTNSEPLALGADSFHSNERLTFHERCGSLVKLSNGRCTAERRRPLDEFNNGVVMTNRPLKDEEVFEIRLDRLVDKWSGSIEVGITTHNPSAIDFPATMTNMRSGTIMMSGCGILTNGKGTRREYGQYNLDALAEGDRIGLIRKSNGSLHYFINGVDQGMASNSCPATVWGVVDLYGMAVKVTILDRNDPNYNHLVNSRPTERVRSVFRQLPDMFDEEPTTEDEPVVERLMFHPRCGSHAAVIANQRTAHRPNAMDDFNNGVVLTNRTLRPTEVFEVRIDKMVDKWAGSIEIGLTLHLPDNLEFPSTMTNIRSGTWMMTGNGVMYNGTTVLDDYGQNLDRLKSGDRVGVVRKENGTVHFFVNGIDQGVAASNVPEEVYGVIDLYGQAAQATIVDQSDALSTPDMDWSSLADTDLLGFHSLHGSNSAIMNGGRTAIRPNATGEFNDAIVISNRALRDNELFEVIIEKMVDRWSGSIEAGVTLIKPEDLEFPNTMTDIEYDTWMLSGSAIMQDGSTIRNGYPLDLDTVTVGCRIGMMRCSDGTLHYYLNGMDQGVACSDISPGVYAVIDLYGQCGQVSVTSGSGIVPTDNNIINRAVAEHSSYNSPISSEISHRFSHCTGKNITLSANGCVASRSQNFNQGLIFSSDPLKRDEIFEVKVEKVSKQWSGSLRIGLTSMAISDTTPASLIPLSSLDLTSKTTWIVAGSEVKKSGVTIKENYAPSLERLELGNRVGVRRSQDGTMHVYLNGESLGIAASNIPKNVFAVIDLYGMVESVSVISSVTLTNDSNSTTPSVESETGHHLSLVPIDRDQDQDTASYCVPEFHCNHGKNVLLSNSNLTIDRVGSYNQGVAVTNKPLIRNKLFKVRIDRLNPRWSASLIIGYLGFSPEKYSFPVSAIAIKKSSVVVQADHVYLCGAKIKEHYGPNLDKLQVGHTVGVLVDEDSNLHLYVNGVDQGVAARDVPSPVYGLVDLYGQCEQVTIVTEEETSNTIVSQQTDDREKADIDDVVKEKLHHRPVIEHSTVNRNCEYHNICQRIKSQLSLPDGYFDITSSACYCEACHKLRGEELYHRRGDPPKEYAVQYGWCMFKLKMPTKANVWNVSEKWHTAYFGTKVQVLRKVLDTGDLHAAGDVISGDSILLPQPPVCTEKSSPDGSSASKIFLSPTLRYAGANEFSPKHKVIDPKTRKSHHVRVAFQVWVKPGSYKVGPQSIGANRQIDLQISNNEIEWSTKERGSVLLNSLLIKVE